MRRFVFLLSTALLMVTPALGASINSWSGYKSNVNCGQSVKNALQVLPNGNLRSTVRHGEVGKCVTDPKPWNGGSFNKPYSERAELIIKKNLKKGQSHKIRFEARILEGYRETDRNENIFQLKGWCKVGDVQVLAFLRRNHPKQFAFYLGDGQFITVSSPVRLVDNSWFSIEIGYDHRSTSSLSITIDGKPIIKNVKFKAAKSCGRVYLRLGVYRGGSKSRTLSTTSVEYRNLKITQQ